ncbi:RagB/SusD family nutrient uptake outer membrane protein [Flavobacterium sp. W22_SRS_FK3]|uniref:RagB/SusD family nutrient uptake outer membrane protein n=1 Tax=Flavobacterium sp. W22_SRS_FK3 TaxID=3240275 RepID=UPI003F933087
MMKKIKYIVVVLSGIFAINSCDTKDLELTNPNALSPETFFKTKSQVEASVNAAYANLQTNGLYGRHIFFALDNMAGENVGNSGLEGNKSPFINFTFDASSDIIQFYWEACFLGISKANFVLDNEEIIQALPNNILTQEQKNKYLGEAHFLRAYYYFLLVPRFGDLPIYTTQTITAAARSPKEEVYKLITDDFDFASKNLLASDDKGRPNKSAAFAYLGKALLYQKKYDEALVALNSVTGYSLEPNFFDNFMEEKEHGVESIFEIEFDAALGSGDRWSSNNNSGGDGANEATLRSQEYGNPAGGGWFNVAPSDAILAAYEPGDKRADATFYKPGSKFNNDANTMVSSNFKSGFGENVRPASWKKYSNLYRSDAETMDSGINFKVMRYSDVLLMKAECENQRAGGVQSTAIGYINEVRARAFTGGGALATTLSKDAVFTAIVHERMVEFAAEQIRFDDLIRWGMAGTVLKDSGFQVGKNELWPIPNRETSSNPKIKPSDNNPGF